MPEENSPGAFRESLFFPLIVALLAVCLLPGCTKTPEDHARIARTSDNAQQRTASLAALAASNNQLLLADVAQYAFHQDVRGEAADYLTDEQLLTRVAKSAVETTFAEKMLERINNQQLLADIVVNGRNTTARAKALEKITDQQVLAPLVGKVSDKDIRLATLLRMTDQPALLRIARDNADPVIANAAMERLSQESLLAIINDGKNSASLRAKAAGRFDDQPALTKLAVDAAENLDVRLAAIGRLTDQQVLAALVTPSKNAAANRAAAGGAKEIRLAAVRKLTDQNALAEIIKTAGRPSHGSDEYYIQIAAAKNMTDQPLLATLITQRQLALIHPDLAEKVTDQTLLADLAKKNTNPALRQVAIRKLADQSLLADIALNDSDANMRATAVERLDGTNPALADIAKNASDTGAALDALRKITDQARLADVAANTRNRIVRENAFALLADSNLLAALARREGDADIGALAAWRLADKSALAELAKDAPDERVRNIAANKLSEASPGAAAAKGNILDLINEGQILAEIRGDNISNINIRLNKTAPAQIEVIIPAGTYFVCDNAAAQNMVATADASVTLGRNSSERAVNVPVACANKPKAIPTRNDSFVIRRLPNENELIKLMAVMGGKQTSYYTKQAAVWIITDDADYNDLDALRTANRFEVRIPGVAYGSRAINEPEVTEAMRLCDEAGIDIKTKRIWHDCEKILAGLKAGDLKNWLKKFSGLAAPAHPGALSHMVISRDGKLLASACGERKVRLWSLPDGRFIREFDHVGDVFCLAFSGDAKWLLSACDMKFGGLQLRSLPSGELVKTVELQEDSIITSAVFSPDNKWFVTADNDGGIRLWSLPDCALIKTLAQKAGAEIALSPDGARLASSYRNTLSLWSVPDGTLVKTLSKDMKTMAVLAFTSDGKNLVSLDNTGQSAFRLWSMPEGVLIKTPEGNGPNAFRGEISPDAKWFLHRGGHDDDKATGWRLWEHARVFTLPDSTGTRCSAFNADSTLLATGDKNGNIKLWSIPDGKLLKTLEAE